MLLFEKCKRVLRNPYLVFLQLGGKGYFKWVPSKIYLSICFRANMGYWLNWGDPRTFNEKIQWLKVYDRNPIYTQMADKVLVKQLVEEKIGRKHIIPTIAVYDSPEMIDFDLLPERFVIKCNHNSGKGMFICKDKKLIDKRKIVKELKKGLRQDYYAPGREWAYKDIKRKILVEQYMEDSEGQLKDYKVFCFNGVPKIIEVDYDRFYNHHRNLYDTNWNRINASIEYESDPERIIEKPLCLVEMLDFAQVLSAGIPHVRVDFYIVDNNPLFGEMTFYHGSGFERFMPKSWGVEMGNWIKLPVRELNS